MSEKREKFISPVGEARWAHVHFPKAAFVDDRGIAKGSPRYQIDVYFDSTDPEWAIWAKNVMDRLRALPEQIDKNSGNVVNKQTPIKKEFDENNAPTGKYYATFKTSDKFKPGVFNIYGQAIPETILIGNGSKVKVNYSANEYSAFGGGINFYLNAIQVVELVEYASKTAEAYGFDVIDSPPVDEGDIPF